MVRSLLIVLLLLLCQDCVCAGELRQAPSGWVEEENRGAAPVAKIGSGGKIVLQGGIEHSQQLKPLPRSLQVGAIFSEAKLGAAPPLDGWYRIPPWLAGDWIRDRETVLSSFNFETGVRTSMPKTVAAYERAQFGVQRDRRGDVWHCRLAANGVADAGSYLSIAVVQHQEPVSLCSERVVIRDVFTELHVNKDTRIVTFSVQAESLTTYEPVSDGTLKASVSVKTFDESGAPLREENSVSFSHLAKPFSILNMYKNVDLAAAFRNYLISVNLEALVPADGDRSQSSAK